MEPVVDVYTFYFGSQYVDMLFGMVLRDFQKPDPITITHSESVHLGHLVVATESVPYLKQSKRARARTAVSRVVLL